MPDQRRWPTFETITEKLEQGVIDDTAAAVSPLDLEDWELRGDPAPVLDTEQAPQREAS